MTPILSICAFLIAGVNIENVYLVEMNHYQLAGVYPGTTFGTYAANRECQQQLNIMSKILTTKQKSRLDFQCKTESELTWPLKLSVYPSNRGIK